MSAVYITALANTIDIPSNHQVLPEIEEMDCVLMTATPGNAMVWVAICTPRIIQRECNKTADSDLGSKAELMVTQPSQKPLE